MARLIRVHSRLVRFLLHVEDVAFPIGFGLMTGSLLAITMMVGFVPAHVILLSIGAAYLYIGIAQFVHRRLGILNARYVGKGEWLVM